MPLEAQLVREFKVTSKCAHKLKLHWAWGVVVINREGKCCKWEFQLGKAPIAAPGVVVVSRQLLFREAVPLPP